MLYSTITFTKSWISDQRCISSTFPSLKLPSLAVTINRIYCPLNCSTCCCPLVQQQSCNALDHSALVSIFLSVKLSSMKRGGKASFMFRLRALITSISPNQQFFLLLLLLRLLIEIVQCRGVKFQNNWPINFAPNGRSNTFTIYQPWNAPGFQNIRLITMCRLFFFRFLFRANF